MPGLDKLITQLRTAVTASAQLKNNVSAATNPMSSTGATWGQTAQAAAGTARFGAAQAGQGAQAANQWSRAKANAMGQTTVYPSPGQPGPGSTTLGQVGGGAMDTLRYARASQQYRNTEEGALPVTDTWAGSGSTGGSAHGGQGAGGLGNQYNSLTLRTMSLAMSGNPDPPRWMQRTDQLIGTAFQDIRMGPKEALDLERQRLRARGGTGDYGRFKDKLDMAVQKYNVQGDGKDIIRDLGTAYNMGMSQLMGGKGKGLAGENAAARMVGELHTLASAAGMDPASVNSAMSSMYSAQSYYSAMATGIQTRDPRTGNAMQTSEIVNQYYDRLKGATTDDIRRSLAPGGMFRAELEQTWGDAGLVEMLSEGILGQVQTGKRATQTEKEGQGGLTDIMKEAGYFGSEWTQGKDSASHAQDERNMYAATYTNATTAGMEMVNSSLASFTNLLNNLPGPFTSAVAALESFGGATDAMAERIPNTWSILEQSLIENLGNAGYIGVGAAAVSAIKFPNAFGDLFTSGTKQTEGQDWTTQANREWRSDNASWWDGIRGALPGPDDPAFDPNWNKTGEGGMSLEEQALERARSAMMGDNVFIGGSGEVDGRMYTSVLPESDSMAHAAVMPDDWKSVQGSIRKGTSENRPMGMRPTVIINLTVSRASEQEAVRFAQVVKREIINDQELNRLGSGTLKGEPMFQTAVMP